MAQVTELNNWQMLLVYFVIRSLTIFITNTWYVPDEYWQTLEVAHKQVFGYGELTWEWQKGIRCYLYPSIISALYYILKFTGLDYPGAVVLLPRFFQAFLSAVADLRFDIWTNGRKWAKFLILTQWFWSYTCNRTLLQSVEMTLVMSALSKFPFKDGRQAYAKENYLWLVLACVCVFIRPTSAPLWIVLCAYNLMTTSQGALQLLLRTYLPIGLIVSGALVALDSYFYGHFIVTPWEFFKFNILNDIASFYGQHPWYWYLSTGIPAVLGVNLLPLLAAIVTILRRPRENRTGLLLLVAAAAHVVAHSFVPHKEFRFVLPLMPIFLYLAQDFLVPWSRKAKKWQLHFVTGLLFLGNAFPSVYFGLFHQSGTMEVMPLLRDAVPNNRSSITFLMPCHSTPLYSHLHINVTTRYLNCDPPIDKIGETYEAEAFFNNPLRWWRNEHANKATPALVVMFDKLKGRLEGPLQGYTLLHELRHTNFPEGEVGENVLVYKKIESQPKPSVDDIA